MITDLDFTSIVHDYVIRFKLIPIMFTRYPVVIYKFSFESIAIQLHSYFGELVFDMHLFGYGYIPRYKWPADRSDFKAIPEIFNYNQDREVILYIMDRYDYSKVYNLR